MRSIRPIRFFINQYASMWIPIRLLISIAIISFFTGLVVIGSQIATDTIQKDQFTNQLTDFKQSIESLYQHGESRSINDPSTHPGSKRIFQITIPKTIPFVFIGKKAEESSELMSSIRFQTEKKTNMIWINAEIPLIQGIYKNDQFHPQKNQTGLELSPGSYCITAELVCDSTTQFILLYHCT